MQGTKKYCIFFHIQVISRMKLLHTADWHLGKRLDHFSRLEEQKAVMDEICEIADREEVDAVLIAGDLFDHINPSIEAIELFARTEGILLDPVYTGKGAAGLIDLVRQGWFDSHGDVVFLHTGGAQGLAGYRGAFDRPTPA